MKCPCKNCILIAICRTRHFIDMVMECELLEKFLFKHGAKAEHYEFRIELIYGYIDPILWGYLHDHNKETRVDTRQDSNGHYIIPEEHRRQNTWVKRVIR